MNSAQEVLAVIESGVIRFLTVEYTGTTKFLMCHELKRIGDVTFAKCFEDDF